MITTQSAVQMTAGDSDPANDSMMEVEEETCVPALGVTRHRLASTAIRGIVGRLRDADADDMHMSVHPTDPPSSTECVDVGHVQCL